MCPYNPSTQSVSSADAIDPSFYRNPQEGNIDLIPKFVQSITKSEESRLPVLLKPVEIENDVAYPDHINPKEESKHPTDYLPKARFVMSVHQKELLQELSTLHKQYAN